MLNKNCKTCIHGGILIGERNSIYKLKIAIGKDREIKYYLNEKGCRSDVDFENKTSDCLNNNYKFYETLEI